MDFRRVGQAGAIDERPTAVQGVPSDQWPTADGARLRRPTMFGPYPRGKANTIVGTAPGNEC